jgi:hypothetical protein
MNDAALLGALLAVSPLEHHLCDPLVPTRALALLLREQPPPPVDDDDENLNLLASRRACRPTMPRNVSSFTFSRRTERRCLLVHSRNPLACRHLRPKQCVRWLSSHAGDKLIILRALYRSRVSYESLRVSSCLV